MVTVMQASVKKDKMTKDDDERARKMIEQQIARALATKGEVRELIRFLSNKLYTGLIKASWFTIIMVS